MRYLLHSSLALVSCLAYIPHVFSHGDHSHEAVHKRDEYISQRSLAACKDNLKARELFGRSLQRRSDILNSIRGKRGLTARTLQHSHVVGKRDLTSAAATGHNATFAGATYDVDSSVLFSGNTSCLLTPEVTEGPYYVSGEYIRNDITENEPGVDLYLDIQIIDINTCEPVSDAYFDAWHVNATGVYSGVIANGNGDSSDTTNINATFCRGVQPTDEDGVVNFKTIFPGHYSGRTTHMHIMAHRGGGKFENGTYGGGNVTHVGQLFFDEDLRTAVYTLSPYTRNTASLVLNANDNIAQSQADNDYDPFLKYAYLGDTISDGLLAWITVGVDTSESYSPSVAVSLTEDGGIANSSGGGSGQPGGSGGNGGNGTMPSGGPGMNGSMPSGDAGGPSGSGGPSGIQATRLPSQTAALVGSPISGKPTYTAIQTASTNTTSNTSAAALPSISIQTSSASTLVPSLPSFHTVMKVIISAIFERAIALMIDRMYNFD